MKTLIILRHAYAETNSDKKDFDRQLTDKGISVAKQMSTALQKIVPSIDLIVSSAAVRAKETAEIFKTTAFKDTPIVLEKDLYYLQFTTLFYDFLYGIENDMKTIMFVGHNPVFTFLAQSLSGNPDLFLYPASFLVVNFETDQWIHANNNSVNNTMFVSSETIEKNNN